MSNQPKSLTIIKLSVYLFFVNIKTVCTGGRKPVGALTACLTLFSIKQTLQNVGQCKSICSTAFPLVMWTSHTLKKQLFYWLISGQYITLKCRVKCHPIWVTSLTECYNRNHTVLIETHAVTCRTQSAEFFNYPKLVQYDPKKGHSTLI